MIFFLLSPFTIVLIFLRCYFDNRKKPLHSTFSKGLIWADEAASEQGPRAAVQRPGACVTQGVGALFHSWSQCFSQTLWWHLPREAEATCQDPGTVLPTWLLATSTNHMREEPHSPGKHGKATTSLPHGSLSKSDCPYLNLAFFTTKPEKSLCFSFLF